MLLLLALSLAASEDVPGPPAGGAQAWPDRLYVACTSGDLGYANYQTEPCELYFHVPISYGSQVPVLLSVTAPGLSDFGFIRTESGNVLCAARVAPGTGTLQWDCHVLVRRNTWSDLPAFAPMPGPGSLPDSVLQWLESTDCCQLGSPRVAQAAAEVSSGVDNLMVLAGNIAGYCASVPGTFEHDPIAFDANYAVNWGNSCTGHAHLAAALFRLNGVPSRCLLNCPTIYGPGAYDQHWIVDYFVPGYGWVTLESTTGIHPVEPQGIVVTYVNQAFHEYTRWFPNSIDALWRSSGPAVSGPVWSSAHSGSITQMLDCADDQAAQAMAAAAEAWQLYTGCEGLILTPEQAAARAQGELLMQSAFSCIEAGDIEGYTLDAQAAAGFFSSIDAPPVETFFSEDFESGPAGWTHGGSNDTWEYGSPVSEPDDAHSGSSCWATGLDGDYLDISRGWLESPPVDLDDRSCAVLSFWSWIDTCDYAWTVEDCIYVQVTVQGDSTPHYVSTRMGGRNDDPEGIADGGWSRTEIDLRRFIGQTVRLRFVMWSDAGGVASGAAIDDVQVYGRPQDLTGVSAPGAGTVSLSCSPDPCRGTLSIGVDAPGEMQVAVSVYDMAGRLVSVPFPGGIGSGGAALSWNCCDEAGRPLPSGVYLVEARAGFAAACSKVVILR